MDENSQSERKHEKKISGKMHIVDLKARSNHGMMLDSQTLFPFHYFSHSYLLWPHKCSKVPGAPETTIKLYIKNFFWTFVNTKNNAY